MAILKCNLDLCKTNSSLNWIGRENLIRFVGALSIIGKKWPCKLYCILSHRPNFLDFNDCLLLFATFYVSLGAPEAGAEEDSRGWPQEKNYSSSPPSFLSLALSTRKTLFRKLRMMLSSLWEKYVEALLEAMRHTKGTIFSCEEAALEVLMSVCLCVVPEGSWRVWRSNKNFAVLVCIKKRIEASPY